MLFRKKQKTEEIAIGRIKENIKKETERLKGLWENLKKLLEDGIRDSFKFKCSRGYTKMLNKHIQSLKKKHEKLSKKLPKDEREKFSLSDSDKKFIKKIDKLISFSVWFPKFYKKNFQAAFRSPKNFFKFFFLQYDFRKAHDYSILKDSLKAIYDFNKTLPKHWKLETIEKDLPHAINFILKNYFTTLDREIENFKKLILEPAKKIKQEQKALVSS
jgi:hypothetical protein